MEQGLPALCGTRVRQVHVIITSSANLSPSRDAINTICCCKQRGPWTLPSLLPSCVLQSSLSHRSEEKSRWVRQDLNSFRRLSRTQIVRPLLLIASSILPLHDTSYADLPCSLPLCSLYGSLRTRDPTLEKEIYEVGQRRIRIYW